MYSSLSGKIPRTQPSPFYKEEISTLASPPSHTNSLELTSNVKLHTQKSKNVKHQITV